MTTAHMHGAGLTVGHREYTASIDQAANACATAGHGLLAALLRHRADRARELELPRVFVNLPYEDAVLLARIMRGADMETERDRLIESMNSALAAAYVPDAEADVRSVERAVTNTPGKLTLLPVLGDVA